MKPQPVTLKSYAPLLHDWPHMGFMLMYYISNYLLYYLQNNINTELTCFIYFVAGATLWRRDGSHWCYSLHSSMLVSNIYSLFIYFSLLRRLTNKKKNKPAQSINPEHSRVGRGILVLRHSVLHFPSNSGSIAC